MPTYTDLEHLADDYLTEVADHVATGIEVTKYPRWGIGAAQLRDGRWATIKPCHDRYVHYLLRSYRAWLVRLRAYGVYDGPTTLTYHGGGNGDRGSD